MKTEKTLVRVSSKLKTFLILCLLFPALSFSSSDPQVCEKIESDLKIARTALIQSRVDINKAYMDLREASGQAWDKANADLNKANAESNKVYADLSETYKATAKHQCIYAPTPACTESLNNLSKAFADLSQSRVDIIKAMSLWTEATHSRSDRDKAGEAWDKANAESNKARADLSQARVDRNKYCLLKNENSRSLEEKENSSAVQ